MAGTITQDAVLKALRNVEDPDLKKDLVTLNMIQDLEISGKRVAFKVVLTTPSCPMKDMLENACRTAIQHLVDSEAEIEIEMTSQVTSTSKTHEELGIRNLVAVASGKGGVGKSTVALNLALALSQAGARVGLIDADIYGPSVPTLLGLVGQRPEVVERDGKQWMIPLEKHGIQVMSIGFLTDPEQAVVWRGPMASKALGQMLTDTAWAQLDYLVLDLPPGTGDVHITVCQQFPLTGAVVVTTPQEVALSDARKAVAMFQHESLAIPVLGVVENMAYFSPPDLPDRKYYLFGQEGGARLAENAGLPLLTQIPLVEQIRELSDAGEPAAFGDGPQAEAFRILAERTAQQIAIRNAKVNPVAP